MYSQIFFLLMSLGDERNILKIFVAGRETTLPDLAPPTHPLRPGAVEHQLVELFEVLFLKSLLYRE